MTARTLERGQPSAETATSHRLAIVIPAYRARFLEEALGSIAAQDADDYRVYVGDDASPEDLASVCSRWAQHIDLSYHRFPDNLGQRDLVAQWERCVAMSSEPWIWVFSDDDIMEPGCVSAWRGTAKANPVAQLFHFDVLRIDADGLPICDEPVFPSSLSARRFLMQRLRFRISSYAPDYVFSREAFRAVGGFQPFPLAWGSDDATWIKLAARGGGIQAIPGARIHWRLSGGNISSRKSDPWQSQEKLEACVQFLEWMEDALPRLPIGPGDPDDDSLCSAGRWWLYRQAEFVDGEFSKLGLHRLAARLGRLRGHGRVDSLLRMTLADWRAVRRRRKSRMRID